MEDDATLRQGRKILELFEDLPTHKFQQLLASGLLSSLAEAEAPTISRSAFESFLGLQETGTFNIKWGCGMGLDVAVDLDREVGPLLQKENVYTKDPEFIGTESDLRYAYGHPRFRGDGKLTKIECHVSGPMFKARYEEILWDCANSDCRLGYPRELIAAGVACRARSQEEWKGSGMSRKASIVGMTRSNVYSKYGGRVAPVIRIMEDDRLEMSFLRWSDIYVLTKRRESGGCTFLMVKF